jgi:hypothetical protein
MLDWPTSIREINGLDIQAKESIYETLIPDWIYHDYGIDPETYEVDGHRVVHFRCPKGSRAMELYVYRHAADRDPILYLNMADTFNNQLLVLLVLVNDPDAPRFNTDIDLNGNPTHFGTVSRNIPAELAAMRAGLAPGQIRRGLRAFRRSLPLFEKFVQNLGHNLFLIEPLAYHNAIIFERYGFGYVRGQAEMVSINKEFRPGGVLYQRLSPANPFREPNCWNSIRGRSWAIHDGILSHPFTGFQMYKRIGIHLGVETFPDAAW